MLDLDMNGWLPERLGTVLASPARIAAIAKDAESRITVTGLHGPRHAEPTS